MCKNQNENCRIISVTLNKGGVGKTTTCINLGVALAKQGHSVLLVDLDPQGHLAVGLGYNPNKFKVTVANLLYSAIDGFPLQDDNILIPVSENLDLLPSNRKLAAVSERLTFAKTQDRLDDDIPQSEDVLKFVLSEYRNRYNYIIIDCQPNVSVLTRNALVAADSVILPIEAHYLAYEGLSETLDIISMIKKRFNPDLKIEGILLTKYQSRTNLCRKIRDDVEKAYAGTVNIFAEPVSYSIRAAEQSAVGMSIFDYDANSAVANAYTELAREVSMNA